jgi:hypothetical protein
LTQNNSDFDHIKSRITTIEGNPADKIEVFTATNDKKEKRKAM